MLNVKKTRKILYKKQIITLLVGFWMVKFKVENLNGIKNKKMKKSE